MDAQKLEIIEKIEQKGLTVQKVAEAIEFDPHSSEPLPGQGCLSGTETDFR